MKHLYCISLTLPFLLTLLPSAFGQPAQKNTLNSKKYLLITFKKGTYIDTNRPEFKKNIQENPSEYEKIQQKYFQLTKLKPTDTLDIKDYMVLNKAFHLEQFPLHCAFSLKNTALLYDRLILLNLKANTLVCSIDNLALTFTACYYDDSTLDEIRERLAGIATVSVVSPFIPMPQVSQFPALANSCKPIMSATPMAYQTLMRIKPTLWGSNSWAYGKEANMVIIESEGDTTYNHCEFNHRKRLNLVNLSAVGTSSNHYYWTLGTLIANHRTKRSTGTDCLGIVPNVGINGVILINEKVVCSDGSTRDTFDNNRYNALLEGINRADTGDVMLMAFQVDTFRPIDEDVLIKKLTRIAVECLKIIIVEAAGNDGTKVDFPDNSGAIIVGAAVKRPGKNSYMVHPNSNYGSRINCFAPGDLLSVPNVSGGYGNYCCTSEAATIMAGVIAGLQSRYKAKKGHYFTPQEIIKAIKDCNTANNGKPVYNNGLKSALGKRIPFADTLWSKLL